MSKTPKELAKEYVAGEDYAGEEAAGAYSGFLAGYQAAQHKDKAVNRTHLAWKLAENYGAIKWLKHKDYKRFGNPERGYEYTIARDGFYQGYQAAKDETNLPTPAKWISVKERLPEIPDTRSISEDVLWLTRYGEMEVSCLERLRSEFRVDWGEAGLLKLDQFTHWMPLPKPPEEEK